MKSFQQYIDQMNELLDQLIQTAKKLRDVSLQVISEEELGPLQKQQEEILLQLEKVDQELHQHYISEIKEPVHEQFHHKLQEFQTLNQEFIHNLNASHGLIQFDLQRLGGESQEDVMRLSHPPLSSHPQSAAEPLEGSEE